MTLRIAWAAPWNVRSAIARSASDMAFELARRGHEVTVFRTEAGDALALPELSAPGPVACLDDVAAADVRQNFDTVVAHFGNNFSQHGALLTRLYQLEAVGVFHDITVAGLVWESVGGDMATMRQLVHATYGDIADYEQIAPSDVAFQPPMLEWLARQTVGAVAHGEHYVDHLRRACPGPVAVIPLAFAIPELPPPAPAWIRMTIATMGRVDPSKRIDQLLLAVGASPILRERCAIRVIGDAPPSEQIRLKGIARAAGVEPPAFTGCIPDGRIPETLRDVDVISCLRNPVVEGDSAILALALASGRPTLVTTQGCYAELPGHLVMKCAPDNEALDAMRHLECYVRNPAEKFAMGKRARDYAIKRYAPSSCADSFLPLLERVVAYGPVRQARRELSHTLAEFGLGADDPVTAELALALPIVYPAGRGDQDGGRSVGDEE